MIVGIIKELHSGEKRVSASPDIVKKIKKYGLSIEVEAGAGLSAGFTDQDYSLAGAEIVDRPTALQSDIVFAIHRIPEQDIKLLKKDALLLGLFDSYKNDDYFAKLCQQSISSVSFELIPRTSRAQSMDVLSSQANIAGYRAVIEASAHYGRFFPMMMTSAGLAKAAKVCILGVGVAGLQAIATARRLGATVEAFDVRPEVKEQVQSLGAKFMDLQVGEEGTGSGGYAKELSDEGKRRQQQALTEKLKGFDVVISTANIPGRKAPVLITEEAVKGMRSGSVIVDMAAANGGNCPLTIADQVSEQHGVKLIGVTNFPSLMPADASQFWGGNLWSFLQIMLDKKETSFSLNYNFEDDILNAAIVTHQGQIRERKK